MEQDTYALPKHPAGADPVTIELYSEHHVDQATRKNLENCLLSPVPKGKKAKILILGARCGLTAQILLPASSHLDIVASDEYYTLLEQRFVKQKDVSYFFGKEGFIGEDYTVKKPQIGDTQVRVIAAEDFVSQVHPHYDVVLLQNCVISDKLNLVKELIKVDHDYLLTMLVPGHILLQPYFPFVCSLEKHILSTFYSKVFHEQVQSKRSITGRRTQIFFYEVFGWKKTAKDEKTKAQIHRILEEASQRGLEEQRKKQLEGNPYQTEELVNVYLNFHYGPDSLGVENYPAACARLCIQKATANGVEKGRALDLGCAVGRTTIQLAKEFKQVVGLDFSKAFVKAAEAKLSDYEEVNSKVKFVVGDACKLDPSLGKFNLVFGGNLIDRLPDPNAFLNSVENFLEPKGVLILTSPYSWLEEYTPKEKWIGGYIEDGKPVTTNEGLSRVLTKAGFEELCPSEDLRFSIKDNDWVYQYTLAWGTFWRKK